MISTACSAAIGRAMCKFLAKGEIGFPGILSNQCGEAKKVSTESAPLEIESCKLS